MCSIVVAIISLLSSIVIVNLQDSREKAAIAKLKEQARQIQTALELYRIDHGEYPTMSMDYDLSIIISDDLSPYIENVTLSGDGIKSFQVVSFAYTTLSFISCVGSGEIPYVISMTTSGSTNLFKRVTIDGASDNTNLYCLNTPI